MSCLILKIIKKEKDLPIISKSAEKVKNKCSRFQDLDQNLNTHLLQWLTDSTSQLLLSY